MNKKQFAYIAFLIWSAINTIILFCAGDKAIQYVAGMIGIGIVAVTFVVDLVFLIYVLILGLSTIYYEVLDFD